MDGGEVGVTVGQPIMPAELAAVSTRPEVGLAVAPRRTPLPDADGARHVAHAALYMDEH